MGRESVATARSDAKAAQLAPARKPVPQRPGPRAEPDERTAEQPAERVRAGVAPFSFAGVPVQAKSRLDQRGDEWEREAERLAAAVLRMPAAPAPPEQTAKPKPQPRAAPRSSALPRPSGAPKPSAAPQSSAPPQPSVVPQPSAVPEVQRKVLPAHEPLENGQISASLEALTSGGEPLPGAVRAFFEPRFGFDFGRVKIHTDGRAASAAAGLGARAFTMGPHIAFAAGEFQPGAAGGMALLAHELAHTIQQGAARPLSALHARVVEPPVHIRAPSVQRDTGDKELKQETLAEVVGASRADELERIKKSLSGLWISDGDVEDVLRILENLDDSVIVALMSLLDDGMLGDYIDNLNAPHAKWRREVLASIQAASSKQDPAALVGKLDTDVLEAMELSGLRMREYKELVFTLRMLGNKRPEKLQHVLRSDNGPAVKRLMTTAPEFSEEDRKNAEGAEKAAREEERKRKAEEEADFAPLTTDLPAEQQLFKNAELEQVVQQMMRIFRAVIFTENDARKIHAFFVARYRGEPAAQTGEPDYPEIRALTRRLDRMGVLDKYVEKLPEDAWEPKTDAGRAFFAVLRYRAPDRNARFVEKLLSYGLFDWAITDREARLAYYVIKQMPLRMQDNFRRRDDGKWFLRMEDNLGHDFLLKDYEGVEVRADKEGFKDVAQELGKDGALARGGDLARELRPVFEKGLDATNAEKIFDTLGERGRADRNGTFVAIRRLEAGGHVRALLDKLGQPFLFEEAHRETTLLIFAGRDPVYLVGHLKELLTRGFTHWAISDREAAYAFYLVRALPQEDRAALLELENGKWWKRIQDAMSTAQKEAASTSFYGGGEGGADRQSIRLQLLDDVLWKAENDARLATLVNMGVAAGDREWVWTQSKEREAFRLHPDLVQRFGLFDPTAKPPRTAYQPEVIAETSFSAVGGILSILFGSGSKHLKIWGAQPGVQGLDLATVQHVMGGDLGGARFVERDAKVPGGGALDDNANRIDGTLDWGSGHLEVYAPHLEIAAYTTFIGQAKLRIGGITVKDAHLVGRVPTAGNGEPLRVKLDVAGVTLLDALYAGLTSMVGASKVGVFTVSAEAGRPGDSLDDLRPKERPRLSVGVPIFSILLDPLLDPLLQGLKAAAKVDTQLEARNPLGVALNIGELQIDGLATSGGAVGIRSINVKNIFLGGGETKSAWYDALVRSLPGRIARARAAHEDEKADKLTAQLELAKGERHRFREKEKAVFELQQKYRASSPDKFSETDQKNLDKLQAEIKGGGLVVDLGEISLSGLEGKVTADDLHLKDVHGEGEGAFMGFELITQPKMIADFVAGGPPQKQSDEEEIGAKTKGTAFSLELGSFDVTNLRVKGSRDVPALAALNERLEALTEKEDAGDLETKDREELSSLRKAQPAVERYWELLPRLTSLEPAERDDFNRARAQIEQELFRKGDVIVDRVHLEDAGIDVALDTTLDTAQGKKAAGAKVTLRAAKLEAEGAQRGSLRVSKLAATGFKFGVGVPGGLLAALRQSKGGEKASAFAELGAETLDIEGVKDASRGLDVQRVHAEGLGADLADLQGDLSAGVRARKIVVTGVSLDGTIEMLWAEQARLEQIPEVKRTASENKRYAEVGKKLAEYMKVKAALEKAEQALAGAKGEAAKEKAQKKLDDAKSRFETWGQTLTSLEVTDLDVALGGLSSGGKKLTIEGRGGPGGNQIAGEVVLEGAPIPGAAGRRVRLQGVTGKIAKDGSHYELTGFGIDDVEIGPLEWEGDGTSVTIDKDAHLSGLMIDATVELNEPGDKKAAGEQPQALKSLVIHKLTVAEMSAHGLHARMAAAKGNPAKGQAPRESMSIDMPSATIRNLVITEFDLNSMKGSISIGDRTKDVIDAGKVLPGFDFQGLSLRIGKSLQVDATLHGRGLTLDLDGPDHRIIKLGRTQIEKAVLSDKDAAGKGYSTTLTGEDIEGGFEQRPDGFAITDVAVKTLTLTGTSWKDDNQAISIPKTATLKGLHIGRMDVKYGPPKAPATPGAPAQKTIKSIDVTKVGFDSLTAESVHYEGDVTMDVTTPKAAKVRTQTRLDIGKAWFNDFNIDELHRNADETVVKGFRLGASGLSGLRGTLEKDTDGVVSKEILGDEKEKGSITVKSMNADLTLKASGEIVGTAHVGETGLSFPLQLLPGDGLDIQARLPSGKIASIDFNAPSGKDMTVTLGKITGTAASLTMTKGGAGDPDFIMRSAGLGQFTALPGVVLTFSPAGDLKSIEVPEIDLDPTGSTPTSLPGLEFKDIAKDVKVLVSSGSVKRLRFDFGAGGLEKVHAGSIVATDGRVRIGSTAWSGPASSGGGGKSLSPDLLNSFTGSVELQVVLSKGGLAISERVPIQLEKGMVWAKRIEKALGKIGDFLVDFSNKGLVVKLSTTKWDPVTTTLASAAEQKDFEDHEGHMHVKYLIDLIKKVAAEKGAEDAKEDAEDEEKLNTWEKMEKQREARESKLALLQSLAITTDLTLDPGTEEKPFAIELPGIGTIKLGKPGAPGANRVQTLGAPFSEAGMWFGLELQGVDFQNVAMDLHLSTGMINAGGSLVIDPDFNFIEVTLTRASIADVDVDLTKKTK